MRNKIKNMLLRKNAVTEENGENTVTVRKKGMEAIEKAVMLVVVLALCVAFKDALIPVITALAEFVQNTALSMFN